MSRAAATAILADITPPLLLLSVDKAAPYYRALSPAKIASLISSREEESLQHFHLTSFAFFFAISSPDRPNGCFAQASIQLPGKNTRC